MDLYAVISEAIALVERDPRKHDVSTFIAESAEGVTGDHSKMVQVIMNLIDNAVKYSPGGGEVTITVEGDPTQDWLTLSVADNGLGLSEEDQGRLFTTFHRVKRDETMDIPGTGLGLYVAKTVVERMGGWISVSSVLDQGSTFSVTLPLMKVEERGPAVTRPGTSYLLPCRCRVPTYASVGRKR